MPRNTIVLKGEQTMIRKEVEADGAITPGMTVSVAGAAGGGARRAFALENDLIGGGVDDAYADGQTVQVGVFAPGAEVLALLGAGENVEVGEGLVDAGDGTLEAVASGGEADVIAYALEAVNNTSSFAVRIEVEVA